MGVCFPRFHTGFTSLHSRCWALKDPWLVIYSLRSDLEHPSYILITYPHSPYLSHTACALGSQRSWFIHDSSSNSVIRTCRLPGPRFISPEMHEIALLPDDLEFYHFRYSSMQLPAVIGLRHLFSCNLVNFNLPFLMSDRLPSDYTSPRSICK